MNDDLISREALKEKLIEIFDTVDVVTFDDIISIIDNAPKVEVPENAVNCVLTMFGKCSYNKTGCSDCEIKEKIRKALENEPKKGKWIDHSDETILFGGVTYTPPFTCSECGKTALNEPWWYCPNCGADMRGDDND